MTCEELLDKLEYIQKMKCETQFLELKSANKECPKRLYDTLSSFSNQDEGGIIIFGIDENNNYEEVGVYNAQELQKKVNEQCLQMEPVVRPLLTVLEKDERVFVSAEIPGMDLADRPCHYKGKGRMKGSYTRIGDSDEPMTEYEIYSYEAFRKKYQDDVREISRASMASLDKEMLEFYIQELKTGKPNLSALNEKDIFELMSMSRNGVPTLTSVMLFSPYPQAYFPQFSIVATVIPGTEMGVTGDGGERFIDNQRIEGNISAMFVHAIGFIKRNMRTKTFINTQSGQREDQTEYPFVAIREAVMNALVHRDYSIHTEGMPIQIIMYEDRLEIINPGGLYGRIRVDQLGKIQPDTRNPVLANAMEVLGVTENRYSGIPTIRREMKKYGLREPEFIDDRGNFIVKFYKEPDVTENVVVDDEDVQNILLFCKTPRSRQEICDYLGLSSITYAIQTHIMPLVNAGKIKMSIPDKPKSPKQLYYSVD